MLKARDLMYEKIERHLEELLNGGKLKPGDRLMSEREIAARFKTSNLPVRQAMRRFIDQGVLEKIHGKGTFVRKSGGTTAATNRIGLLYCSTDANFFSVPFYAALFAGIEWEARNAENTIVLKSLMTEQKFKPGNILAQMQDLCDGVLLLDPFPDVYTALEKQLRQFPRPLVVVNYENAASALDSVVFDSFGLTRDMTRMLIGQGHKRIGFYQLQTSLFKINHPNFQNRQEGYRSALREAGLPINDERVLLAHRPAAIDDFKKLVRGPQAPTALVCADDDVALNACRFAAQLGLRVPADLSIVGFDNIRDAETATPPLTTVHTPLYEMGNAAVKRLLEKIAEKQQRRETHQHIVLPGEITKRESHRKIT
jgi:DNA-binding LacI/PurR family transcriptional regulator